MLKTFNLVKNETLNKIDSIKVIYLNNEIKNVSVTKVTIWNNGNEVINKLDVAAKNPIRFEIDEEYDIMYYKTIFIKNEANNFSLTKSESGKSITLDFDYFYEFEGISFEVYHTGISGKNIRLVGTLKDCKLIAADKDIVFDYVFGNNLFRLREKMDKKTYNNMLKVLLPLLVPIIITLLPLNYYFSKNKSIPKEYLLNENE